MKSPLGKLMGSVFFGVILLAMACSTLAGEVPPKAEKVVYSFPTKNFELLALLFGAHKGFYREMGLEIDFKYLANPIVQAGLEKGEIDYTGILGTGLRSALSGRPVKAITHMTVGPNWAIIGQPELNSLADLRGKIISFGSAAGTTARVGKALLRSGGLNPDKDVQIIVIQHNDRALAAMISKSTAATILQEPAISIAVQRGFKILANALDVVKIPASGLVVAASKLAKNRDQVKRFAKATLRSLKYVRENRDEVSRFIAKEWEIDDLALAMGTYDGTVRAMIKEDADPTEGIKAAIRSEQGALGQKGDVPFEKVADVTVWKEAQRELGYIRDHQK